jgi:predicted Zn-dependent protease with MMP-like domain
MSDALERAWDAWGVVSHEEVLALLREAPEDEPEAWCLAALVFVEAGEFDRAARAVARAEALGLAADDDDLLMARGELALATWDLDTARAAYEELRRTEGEWTSAESAAGACRRLALVADLRGDLAEGDRQLAHARRLVGEPPPPRLSTDEFEALVAEALDSLPAQFRAALEHVAVIVDPMPSADLARSDPAGTPPELLGLFVGRNLLERDAEAGPEPPPAVYLFQRNLERVCTDREELLEEIRVTLYHELGHALGFEEDEVHDMGLG